MLKNIKTTIGRNLTNAQGWRTNRKIIVFESDDWGSIRMPNKNTLNKFTKLGFDLSKDPYCNYDTIANSEDLIRLFEVLRMYKNNKGYHPKFTFNTVMANPLFNEIRESNYTEYFYEPFTDTLKRYYSDENIFEIWKQGIDEKLIQPQFHGREHVNVYTWLRKLKEGNKPLVEAFALEFWGIPKSLYGMNNLNIQASFGLGNPNQLRFYKENIHDGLKLFEDIFGFKSKTFISNNYTYPEHLNPILFEEGVIGIQSMRKQKIPQENGTVALKELHTGKVNEWQQTYTVRNCNFEPSQMPKSLDNVGSCLKQISNSFFWKKPAIINSHRLNYIGSINKRNRIHNLDMLKSLLSQIIKTWPDVEFLSSDELVDIIN